MNINLVHLKSERRLTALWPIYINRTRASRNCHQDTVYMCFYLLFIMPLSLYIHVCVWYVYREEEREKECVLSLYRYNEVS